MGNIILSVFRIHWSSNALICLNFDNYFFTYIKKYYKIINVLKQKERKLQGVDGARGFDALFDSKLGSHESL